MKDKRNENKSGSNRKKNAAKLVKVSNPNVLQDYMKGKLAVFEIALLICFFVLIARVVMLGADNEEEYKRLVMRHLQTKYDSRTIPYRRGSIVDRNGTTLAVSDVKYNVILDTNMLAKKPEEIEPTLVALQMCFDVNISDIRAYMASNPQSQYYILQKING